LHVVWGVTQYVPPLAELGTRAGVWAAQLMGMLEPPWHTLGYEHGVQKPVVGPVE
jgi:hypothetical protein